MIELAQPSWQEPLCGTQSWIPTAARRGRRHGSRAMTAMTLARGRLRAAISASHRLSPTQRRLLASGIRGAGQATDVAALTATVESAAIELLGADRATLMLIDSATGRLWHAARDGRPDITAPSAGIAGFVARSGIPVFAEHAADNHRYCPVVDDPAGSPSDRLAAVPVHDNDGTVRAILIAVRTAQSPLFATAERRALVMLASGLAPVVAAEQGATESARRRRDEKLGQMFRIFLPVIMIGLLLSLLWRP